MKTIIAGSRDLTDYPTLLRAIKAAPFGITSVVCGMARGVDMMGYQYAQDHGLDVHKFPADWKKYGRSAGPIRNMEMARSAEALIALWDGKSPGTLNMINAAYSNELKVHVHRTDQ